MKETTNEKEERSQVFFWKTTERQRSWSTRPHDGEELPGLLSYHQHPEDGERLKKKVRKNRSFLEEFLQRGRAGRENIKEKEEKEADVLLRSAHSLARFEIHAESH